MAFLRQWLLGVVSCAFLVSLLDQLTPEGSVRKLARFSGGLVLSCGCSTGGLDILGLYLSKKGSRFTVGRFSISFNALLYTLCFFLFDATTAIYSAIYNVLSSLFLDRIHRQNVTVQLLIFTKKNDPQLPRYIMEQLDRGVTSWMGRGGRRWRRRGAGALRLPVQV